MALDCLIRVMLAEDDTLLLRALAKSLRTHPDIELLAETENGAELVASCQKHPPDVAVLDIRMPVMDGVTAARLLRKELPQVKLLILTTFDDDRYLQALYGLGVDGYLLKSGDPKRLAEAVRSVYHGIGAVDGAISRKLGSLLNPSMSKAPQGSLSQIEGRVAELIAQGKYNKEIAVELDISYGHARNLVSKVYSKLGAIDRDDLTTKLRSAI